MINESLINIFIISLAAGSTLNLNMAYLYTSPSNIIYNITPMINVYSNRGYYALYWTLGLSKLAGSVFTYYYLICENTLILIIYSIVSTELLIRNN